MIQKLKSLAQRTSFVLVAALIVAVYPASASADTAAMPVADPVNTATSQPADGSTPSPDQIPAGAPAADSTANSTTGAAAATTSTPDNSTKTAQSDVTGTTNTNASTPAVSTPQTTVTDKNTATVDNKTASTAKSGNATVAGNTTAGNATSGNASVTNTTVNSLQSNSSFTGSGKVTTWTTDIDGDHVGDILLNPSQFTDLQVTSGATPQDLTVNTETDSQINSNISLDAQSGDAMVADNGTAGSATTGDATAAANIVNIVNSFVGADHTFVGTINIRGNLDGDILLPGTTLADLLAAQSQASNGNATIASTANTTIHNNISATATSGNANVADNTAGGNATTGSAMTNVNIVNLTGQRVVAKNSLVVFVNVMGTWVGFIMNAPAGATSAALGDGVASQSSTGNTAVTNSTTTTITNNVSVNAASGDASVTKNGTAGDATSGKASASANILNMADDNLSLGGWFGILFINVLGGWTGSFGVDTAAGTVPVTPVSPTDNTPQTPATTAPTLNNTATQNAVLSAQTGSNSAGGSTSTNSNKNDSTKHTGVLGASSTTSSTPTLHSGAPNWHFAATGVGFSLLLLIAERLLSGRARKREAAKAAAPRKAVVLPHAPQSISPTYEKRDPKISPIVGGDTGTRTLDPLLAKQVL